MFAIRSESRPVDERIDAVRLKLEILLNQPVQQFGTGKGLHNSTEIGFSANLQNKSENEIPATGGQAFTEGLPIGRDVGFGAIDCMRNGQILVVVERVVRPSRLPLRQRGPVVGLCANANTAIGVKAILRFGLMGAGYEVAGVVHVDQAEVTVRQVEIQGGNFQSPVMGEFGDQIGRIERVIVSA